MATERAARIRPATVEDAAALSLVGSATFLESFANLHSGANILAHCARNHSAEYYARALADSRAAAWLLQAMPGEAPVGYALLAPADVPVPDLRDDDLELKRIYLLQPFQGGGHGRRLVEAAATHARGLGADRLLLGVWSINVAALRFYAQLGFRRAGERTFHIGEQACSDHLLALKL